MVTQDQIVSTHRANPTWHAAKIGAHLNCSARHVRVVAARNRMTLPPQPIERADTGTVIELGRACRKAKLSLRDIEKLSKERSLQPTGG